MPPFFMPRAQPLGAVLRGGQGLPRSQGMGALFVAVRAPSAALGAYRKQAQPVGMS